MKLAWLLLHACCWQAACLTWHPDKNPENQDCLMGFAESPNRVITVRARPLQRKSSNFCKRSKTGASRILEARLLVSRNLQCV